MAASKFTFEIPPDLRRLMDRHPEVNWSAVFREAIRRQAETAEIAERLREEWTDPRVAAVARAAKRRVGERFRAAPPKRTPRRG